MKFILDFSDNELFDTDYLIYGVSLKSLLSLQEIKPEDFKVGKN